MSTLSINVKDMSVPITNPVNIAVVNQPNPVENYTANADEVYQLINIPKYRITDASTGTVVTGENYYTYFPEKNPGGGGGGGGGDSYSRAEIDRMMLGKVDKVNGKGLSTNDFTDADKTKVTNAISSTDAQSLIDTSQTSQENSFVDITSSDIDDMWTSDLLILTESNGTKHTFDNYTDMKTWMDEHSTGNYYSVVMGTGITDAIPDNYFKSNSRVTSIECKGAIETIGEYAFSDCANLLTVDISKTVITAIETGTFWKSLNLTGVALPDTIIEFKAGAFANISELKTIGSDTFIFPASLTTIRGGAFSSTNIEHINFNDGITTIDNGAFSNNQSYTQTHTITFQANTGNSIAAYAFTGCNNVSTITVHKTEGSIDGAPWGAKSNGGSGTTTVIWDG